MREHLVRGAAIAMALALLTAACSSSHKSGKSSTTVIPTVATPTTVAGSATTAHSSPTTTKPSSPTKSGTGATPPGGTTTTAGSGTTSATPTTVSAPLPTYLPGIVMRWELALDFRTHPGHNPFSSYRGGAPVWSVREGSTLDRDGLYPLLPSFSSTFGSEGIAAWHDSSAGCPNLPAVGVNTVGAPIPLCGASIPGDAAFLDPDPAHSAVVAWTSTFNGTVNISYDGVVDLDGKCGDGVGYFVDVGTRQLASVLLTANNSATLPPMKVQVTAGESLYFIVEPGGGDVASCDATQLAITIDQLG